MEETEFNVSYSLLVQKVKGSLKEMGQKKNFILFHKHFNITAANLNETNKAHWRDEAAEGQIRISVANRENFAEENMNHMFIAVMMEDQNNCINIPWQQQACTWSKVMKGETIGEIKLGNNVKVVVRNLLP